jgi:DNA-binding YbaB/EbfC family protein
MKGFPGGMQQFMKQFNQMQSKLKKVQAELDEKEYSATSGGSAVKVTVKGKSQISALEISPEVLESPDPEMLQDLILTAANEALETADKNYNKEIEKLTGGMAMPGLF